MTDRPRNPLALIPLICLTTIGTLWTSSATGETNCSTSSGAEGVCVTKDALRKEATRVAEGFCSEERADLQLERDKRQRCEGQLLERPIPQPVVEPWRAPLWVRVALDIGVGASAAGVGACAGVGCPREATIGLVVASVGVLAVRLLFEVL